jgi:hypothetical protein
MRPPAKNQPRASTEEGIRAVLVEHYATGASLNSILERDDTISRATYFRVKADQPELLLALERKARDTVSELLSSTIDLNSLRDSAELQREATKALLMAIPKLAEIAQVKGWPDERADREGNINVYPRDIVEAVRMLHIIGKEGLISETLSYSRMKDRQSRPTVEDRPQLLPVISAGRDFKSLKATKPDGTEISVSVDQPDVVEVLEPDD